MYEKHFGLTRRPFATTADTPTYYPSTSHECARKQLTEAVQQQEGYALLTGEPGLGKTLVAHRVLEELEETFATLWLGNTHLPNSAALFQALLYDLGQPYEGKSEQELRLQVTDHLLQVYKQSKQTLLLIDEAHYLTPPLLEELRLLGNLETRQGKVLQVILVGQRSLSTVLRQPRLESFAQRVRVQARLFPMDLHEAVDYVVHHLRAAGGRPERIITEEALEIVARGCNGVPRLLNQATHVALQMTFSADQSVVDAEAALEALSELGLSTESCDEFADESRTPTPWPAPHKLDPAPEAIKRPA